MYYDFPTEFRAYYCSCIRYPKLSCVSSRPTATPVTVVISMSHVVSSLSPPFIDMAEQHPLQTAKKSKGFCNRLKNIFGQGSQSTPLSRLNSPPDSSCFLLTAAAPPADSLHATTEVAEAAKLQASCTHFRVLIVGRANSGKTTVLKRVCNTKEDPVYNEVTYPLPSILHSYRPFPDRLTQLQRCQLDHPCALL